MSLPLYIFALSLYTPLHLSPCISLPLPPPPAAGIPVILVVLHHTFSPAFCVPDSGRHATSAVSLTVDMLFHQTCGLLRCSTNDIAIQTIFNQVQYIITSPENARVD